MSGLLARTLFYPTLLYNVAMEKLTSRRWYDRIDATVLLGALPFRSMTQTLVQQEGVKAVVTMNEDFELKRFTNSMEEWSRAGVEQLRLTTIDLTGVPTHEHLKLGVLFLLRHREQGNTVYVHCKAGRRRSATLVACYLMQVHGWTPEEAHLHIKEKRPHITLARGQREALDRYYTTEHIDEKS
ncbi:Phosphatidylglycerophosphatase and protein-tyrosine phosphatase 1 [Branchiostoma belcheri]|nr:Phosphatidylglycerophosphatase and protein-tyrosine phosphatase 1 [Branchiostoma belcheri]